MEYILLDNFNGNLNIVSKEDGSGEPLVFDTIEEAQEKLDEYCQDGQIIPLGVQLFTLKQVLDLLSSMQQGITPELFKSSEKLGTEDFFDLPICKAQELGIKEEFKDFMNSDKNFKEKYLK